MDHILILWIDEDLVKRRRLGQTDLSVRAGQVGTSNATKLKNLGTFDYAHLRVPLPKDVMSGIFHPAPASYFLMRRSHDGYISATGMFKASFPWAELQEEENERKYIKSLETTSPDETAGNIWIPPLHALELAEEYQITPWIKALLDNAPIELNPTRESNKSISPPPKFLLPQESLAAPTPSKRARRSASPSKIASPRKSQATPRKPKTPKAATMDSHNSSASKSLQQALKEAATAADEAPASANDDSKVVRVHVDTNVEVNGNVETTHTHVEVEMPAGSADLPLPEDTEGMIAKAKEMVEAAVKAENAAGPSKPKKLKRKVDSAEDDEAEKEKVEAGPVVKKAKVESELKKERVKTRALIGISATLAIG